MATDSTGPRRFVGPVPSPRRAGSAIHAPAVSLPALLASALLLASCAGSDGMPDAGALAPASADRAETRASDAGGNTPGGPGEPAGANAAPAVGGFGGIRPVSTGAAAADPDTVRAAASGGSDSGRRVSLRPIDNVDADDLLDRWGHRRIGPLSDALLEAPEPGDDASGLRNLLDAARKAGPAGLVPDLHDGDAVTALGERRGVSYGRWTGGPADTLSVEFDFAHATREMRENLSVRAVLERAGKVWSRRIDDTWEAWERRPGETRARLIGDYGATGKEIRVGPEGETSTGLAIYVTDPDLAGNEAGRGGPGAFRPGSDWEPHTGAVALDSDHVEGAEEAQIFHTAVHEIGHVLGAWYGVDPYGRDWPHTDREAGAWTGPHVVSVHRGAAPFQNAADAFGWHEGERSPDGRRFDFLHSGVCASVMAYCTGSAAIPAFLPAEVDFAFLADIGMTILPETGRPETYGLAGWMAHAAFTLSVSRQLDVSLADPQPRYFDNGAQWTALETVDLLWAEADAFGERSAGNLRRSFPLAGTARYAGGLIGAAVDHAGLPPVVGDANLSIGLDDLTGKASFTSLRVLSDGERDVFGAGSLHYPIAVAGNAIIDDAPGVSLAADFYGPRHDEIAGTLDDSRAGLVASFGARRDDRPDSRDVVAGADRVRGMMLGSSSGIGDGAFGWHRLRCGAGSDCASQYRAWGEHLEWNEVAATDGLSPRERVLALTAGWGEWLSEDLLFDGGAIRMARRHAGFTDGRRGRYGADGYYGTMTHAAFGVGSHNYRNWAGDDGELGSSSARGAGFQGELAGSAPDGHAVWQGRMVGRQSGLAAGEDPFVQGAARVSVSLSRGEVDIGFTGVTAMDRGRSVADFGFAAVPLGSDGTFFGYDQGHVEGAFFGPAHEEVAGAFQNNANSVLGAFGAVQLPDDVTLGESGSASLNWNGSLNSFETWGYWAGQYGETVFEAHIDQAVRQDGGLDEPEERVAGTPAGSNPVSGSATWSGGVRAFEPAWHWTDILYAAVEGKARLEFDFGESTLDVDFTDFDRGHGDMSWRDIPVSGGAFRSTDGSTASPSSGGTTVEGAFYGVDHHGVAGTFDRDRLQGVFGAIRSPKSP